MSAPASAPPSATAPVARIPVRRTRRQRVRAIGFHGGALLICALWTFPILLVVSTAFRTFDDIASRGLASLPRSFTLDGFRTSWTDGGVGRSLWNGMQITIPALLITLLLASMAAYALSRYELPLRRTILLLMLGGNLLPPQVILIPINRMMESYGLFDTLWAVIIIHVTFGLGFYVFVLQGFMRTIPAEIQQAATVDGAGPFTIYWRIIMPLTRPALGALGALGFTWIFNDLLWSITVLRSEENMPTTPALLGLQGAYLSDWGLIASATITAAVPTVAVFLAFQRQFVGGLTLGAVK
jgi:multiple sugar transport system permease protein